jgi:triacylglycerol esterase/lipase EstA (alpha/beta hydrolase family)
MCAAQATLPPPSTALRLLEARAVPEFGAFWLMRPWLSFVAPPGDGHPVLVLPGLLADDGSTSALRNFLNSHGYAAHGWNQGRNFGLRANLERDMLARIDELFERHGRRRISLVGWSLGGLYARQLAKIVPDRVRCLISLGSPFAGSPKSTNAWRTYEIVSGSKVEDQSVLDTLVEAPPVPTTSIFSRTDGICAWQACLNKDGPQAENIEVYGSHCGLGHHPAVVYAIADRLGQPEGAWKKFDRSSWRHIVFPDWQRA